MQAHLLVGPIAIVGRGGAPSSTVDSNFFIAAPPSWNHRRHRRFRHSHRWSPLTVSSAAAINGEQNHYAVLGLNQTATSADIKKAYRLLARKVRYSIPSLSYSTILGITRFQLCLHFLSFFLRYSTIGTTPIVNTILFVVPKYSIK